MQRQIEEQEIAMQLRHEETVETFRGKFEDLQQLTSLSYDRNE